ncbi:hypothetical protein AKO1_003766 [Acrasis kona]|uniref:Helicase C-terminal domain-containing protein n=1 Tax=Acrasis kona TaxID=1008807 RepID=A0AAW2Z6A5_9EUKA
MAGGQGINLTGASRVVVYDVTWDPTWSSQAIFRAYRFRQTKPVHIYRFVTCGTIEERIWLRCIAKMWLFKKIVDSQNPLRRIGLNDLDLYKSDGIDDQHVQSNLMLNPTLYDQDVILKSLLGTLKSDACDDALILHPVDVTQEQIDTDQVNQAQRAVAAPNHVMNQDEADYEQRGGEFDVKKKIASVYYFESLYLEDPSEKLSKEDGDAAMRAYQAQMEPVRMARAAAMVGREEDEYKTDEEVEIQAVPALQDEQEQQVEQVEQRLLLLH